ncbi:unnamed protein product [Medioppia subpectinata]|uniref:Uncharacterized protein n=1 Tax=Medioppia subpectinata TaxID=1979941 RepID=A0A7R9Q6Q1_9ACAR|nr:unnamed protein product [Medioppia subpectinata]CAG2114832.1 unnamed protein product [Medioppia subpectinata]
MDNPLCNPNITIDSAFVDKYCDLGSDVITLFADNTVYQLNVNTTDPITAVFTYNRSQSLNEWTNGVLRDGPINTLTVDEIRSYLSQTTAGFALNDYFYLFAGNRVCRVNNRTLRFDDNCLTQTIGQWIGCKDMRTDPKDFWSDDLNIESNNKSKISETKSLTEMSSLDENRPIDLKITTTTSTADKKSAAKPLLYRK